MAERPARPLAMDPPHITEFASEAYFEKLNQLNARQQQTQTDGAAVSSQAHSSQQSRFILPLRESKIGEVETLKPVDGKKEKKGFFNLRHKVSVKTIPKTATIDLPESVPFTLPIRTSTESSRKSIPLDQRFLSLPNELQIQIISSLPLTDVLNLRRASKSWHSLITANEAPIVRYHLDHHIPAYATRLYPIENNQLNFHYLCSLWHRLHVAAKLAYLMCEWITKDIFLRQTDAQRAAFAPQRERMRRRLIPLLFTVFHFFEMYRKLHLEYIAEHGGCGLQREPYTVNPIEAKIMSMYDDRTLLRVHEVFPLVISSFCRRLRPPTYVGRVERSLRGYIREKPADDIHVAILCLGGLRQVERLWEIKGYNSRRAEVDVWYSGLTKEKDPGLVTKPRRSIIGFGRKKSTSIGCDVDMRASFSETLPGRRSSAGSISSNHTGWDPAWIFNTSLAAGMPMDALEKDHAECLLRDLPVLQQIWLPTAEAIILDRKIVNRTQDIKRNQAVMLDLISEAGIDEEDEWWYGSSIPDSVRPPVAGVDDEAE